MLHTQLDFLCNTFGNQSLPDNEKWKCIKNIYVENPLVDVENCIKNGKIQYINNESIGPGFYIMSTPDSSFGVHKNESVVTFIPLKLIDKISINLKSFQENINIQKDSNDEFETIIE